MPARFMHGRASPRIDNDIIWIGRAANIAAKLGGVLNGYRVLVTDAVYKSLLHEVLNDVNTVQNVRFSVNVPQVAGYGLGYVCGTNAHWVFFDRCCCS